MHVRALFVTVEETPQHRDRKALAAIGDQPLLDLGQRHVRAAPDQAQQIVAMRLDPAGASVAATRRRRNFARGLEPLHPAHCARYAIMAEIVVKRLVEHLDRAGFVVMKRLAEIGAAALGRGFEG